MLLAMFLFGPLRRPARATVGDVTAVDLAAIRAAVESGRGLVEHTPVVPSPTLSERTNADVVLKAENLQRTGAFKIRGAMHTLATLGQAARRGVTAGSAGNHAQALARPPLFHGVPCELFVPAGASISKVEACRSLGAVVHEGGASVVRGGRRGARPCECVRAWRSATRSTTRSWWPARAPSGSSWSTTCPTSRAWSCRSAAEGSRPGSRSR